MKKIVVLASMRAELAFLDAYEKNVAETKEIFSYSVYDLGSIRLIGGVCGTGKVSAALCAQCAVRHYSPDLVISLGTCGALGTGSLCDVIVATDCVQHDYDTSPFWGVKGELTELKTIALKADEKFLKAAKAFTEGNASVLFGRVLTGDMVVVDDAKKRQLVADFGGLGVDMEAGAIAQTCAMMGCAYGAVKGISDSDKDHEHQFRSNLGAVAVSTGQVLMGAASIYAEI